MSNPRVAIIIANYNKAKYIADCIKSAINQTYGNLEIIIVDDCSTDNSLSTIKKLAAHQPNIQYHILPNNHGVSYARNYGAKQTEAEYLTFLDSDDFYINKDKIKNEIKKAGPQKIAYSQWIPINESGKELDHQTYKNNPLRGTLAIAKILSIALPPYQQLRGYMIPTALFREIGGYNTSLSLYEDFDLQCRLGLNAKFVYTKSIGEAYRLGTGGLSSQSIENAKKAICQIQKKYYSKLNPIQKKAYLLYKRRKNEKK